MAFAVVGRFGHFGRSGRFGPGQFVGFVADHQVQLLAPEPVGFVAAVVPSVAVVVAPSVVEQHSARPVPESFVPVGLEEGERLVSAAEQPFAVEQEGH